MAGETSPLLLAVTGGEPSDAVALRSMARRIAALPPPVGWGLAAGRWKVAEDRPPEQEPQLSGSEDSGWVDHDVRAQCQNGNAGLLSNGSHVRARPQI